MVNKTFGHFSISVMVLALSLASFDVRAETGVTDQEIRLGVSAPLTGSASGVGLGLQKGFMAFFKKVNANGGVFGRKIVVTDKDDGYEPDRTARNTQELIDIDKSFVLFNFFGTPTSKVAVPLARRYGVPYLFPFSGGDFLRSPADPLIFNLRASYFDEIEMLVEHFTKDLGFKRIGVFTQRDAYGDTGLSGVVRALAKRGLKITGEGRYKRNTIEIDEGFEAIKKANPEAVILVGLYEGSAEFVKRARKQGLTMKFANISGVGGDNLIRAMGSAGEGTYISEIMPSPRHSQLPIVREYREALGGEKSKDLGYESLEGYVNAAFLVDLLTKTGRELTREKFLKTADSYTGEVGGLKAKYTPKDHQAFDQVYLTRVQNGEAIEVDKMEK